MKKLGIVETVSIGAAIIIMIVAGVGFGVERSEYNNGICPECGNHYELIQAASYRHSVEYIYKCNGCGKVVQVPWLE